MNKLKHDRPDDGARISDYQKILKEKDDLIAALQLENLALKGSLREAIALIQNCINLLQLNKISIPSSVATFLGQSCQRRRVSASLKPNQMEEAYRFKSEEVTR